MGVLRGVFAASLIAHLGCSSDNGSPCSGALPGDYIVVLQRGVDANVASARIVADCGGEVNAVWTAALEGFDLRCDARLKWPPHPGPWPSTYCSDVVTCVETSSGVDYVEQDRWSCADVCPCGGPSAAGVEHLSGDVFRFPNNDGTTDPAMD